MTRTTAARSLALPLPELMDGAEFLLAMTQQASPGMATHMSGVIIAMTHNTSTH
jgi:hypothetical protein